MDFVPEFIKTLNIEVLGIEVLTRYPFVQWDCCLKLIPESFHRNLFQLPLKLLKLYLVKFGISCLLILRGS